MSETVPNVTHEAELRELKARLRETEQALDAIRSGEVDALVVSGPEGEYIYSLTDAQEPYRLMIEQMAEGALTLSRDGRVLYSNASMARLIDTRMEYLVGRSFVDFVVEEERERTRKMIESAWNGDRWSTVHVNRSDGSTRSIYLGLTRINFKPETVLCVVASDLTTIEENIELRRLKAQLDKTVAVLATKTTQLETANKELEAFSYSVSHDLRAPLRHIAGFIGLLANDAGADEDPQRARYLEIISEAAERMGLLIDALLALSRTNRVCLARGNIDLNKLVDRARHELAPSVGDRDIVWQVHPLPAVVGDEALMAVVLTNLLSNAIKYTRGRAETAIEIGCSELSGDEATIFVRDNGVGFDMAYAEKLFGVFQRLHGEDEFEGIGIGLATVQRIIHRHGGRIWAEAEHDKGATFYFTLDRGGHRHE